jgi:hypothetical protein
MEKVLVYTESLNYMFISTALEGKEILTVSSKYDLAVKITEEDDLLCVIVQFGNLDENTGFLRSINECFPILPVIILINTNSPESIGSRAVHLIEYNGDKDKLNDHVKKTVSDIRSENRRKSRRFKWPLTGYITCDKKNWHKYSIKSISSSGAFLECKSDCPEAGKKAILRVIFKNFKLYTLCRILDRRESSSNLPDGFGVFFIKFSEPSKIIIDKIIDDALIKVITDPETEPDIPSIGQDMLLIDKFELM